MKQPEKIQQVSFFEEEWIADYKPAECPQIDLDKWALIYLVTRRGGYRGNLFILSVEDAQNLCEDPCSKGMGRGGEWCFMWTSIKHFINKDDCYGETKHAGTELPKFVFITDTGKQDKDFERLGIHKPSLEECREIINAIGYEIDYTYKGLSRDGYSKC